MTPEKYKEVYNDVGKTGDIGKDWKLNNYKELSKVWKKIEGISEMKRIVLKKSKLTGKNNKEDVAFKTEIHYNIDDPSKPFTTLAKRGYKVML